MMVRPAIHLCLLGLLAAGCASDSVARVETGPGSTPTTTAPGSVTTVVFEIAPADSEPTVVGAEPDVRIFGVPGTGFGPVADEMMAIRDDYMHGVPDGASRDDSVVPGQAEHIAVFDGDAELFDEPVGLLLWPSEDGECITSTSGIFGCNRLPFDQFRPGGIWQCVDPLCVMSVQSLPDNALYVDVETFLGGSVRSDAVGGFALFRWPAKLGEVMAVTVWHKDGTSYELPSDDFRPLAEVTGGDISPLAG